MTSLVHEGSWSEEKQEVACDILAYVAEHPEASDTLEGIVEWWLLRQKIEYQTRIVKEALGELVEKGLLVKQMTKDSRIRYRANEEKVRELESLIQRNHA
jgi:hypothetical protein